MELYCPIYIHHKISTAKAISAMWQVNNSYSQTCVSKSIKNKLGFWTGKTEHGESPNPVTLFFIKLNVFQQLTQFALYMLVINFLNNL